ncbi:ABC transporter substrate-binding protein [Microvirga rosea]|uniref:ABC transporter substrate-binding protein n=1 Tax=Microvirga rosea TaxID=2715425 RepID=UPI001D0A97CD|nr:ABC transporter substrate-binding protein [Microvirga rosea]MCB8823225.1 ABC transporter substrate-binding protein [Microvirga rosea]
MKIGKTANRIDGISRRTVLTAGAGALLAIPFIKRAEATEKVLYVNTWGGLWDEVARDVWFKPFTKETGIEIKTVSPVSFAKLAAQARTGVYEFDVTTLGVAELGRAHAAKIIEPIEGSAIDRSALWDGAVIMNGVKSHAFSNAIVYRKDHFPNGGPQNWRDFWDVQKFNGSRSLQRYAARTLAFALLADGVAPEQLFPYDLDRGFAALDRLKPHLRVLWTQGPQSAQLVRDGEVEMIGMWTGQAGKLVEANVPVEIVWNQALLDQAFWVVAKGTPRAENAWRFIQSAVKAERLAEFCLRDKNGPLNPKAFDFISPEQAKLMPTYPENFKQAIILDPEKIAPQLDELNQRFDRWISS